MEAQVAERDLFPASERVILERNPLIEVVCQLRFPPILKVDAELPALFQEAIRSKYPFYGGEPETSMPVDVPPQVRELLSAKSSTKLLHRFTSQDGQRRVTLARDYVALETSAYSRWEEFEPALVEIVDSLITLYSPAMFTRIGLRYVNALSRETLGLTSFTWSDLLCPEIAGELACEGSGFDFARRAVEFTINLPQSVGQATVRHGLAETDPETHTMYLIDCDLYAQRVPIDAATKRLNDIHSYAGRIFRWCISSRVLEALKPLAIS